YLDGLADGTLCVQLSGHVRAAADGDIGVIAGDALAILAAQAVQVGYLTRPDKQVVDPDDLWLCLVGGVQALVLEGAVAAAGVRLAPGLLDLLTATPTGGLAQALTDAGGLAL